METMGTETSTFSFRTLWNSKSYRKQRDPCLLVGFSRRRASSFVMYSPAAEQRMMVRQACHAT